ncbi:MAG: substrate-binding domain-containing protein, partial [Verrucomicrobia bacterium]|nr:substrate-binding domain-containing protein [Verrucomicrobiota bacterium]
MTFLRSWLLLGTCLALIVCGCGRHAGTSLTVAGSTAFQPFAEKLAEQFMAKRPDVNITVQGGGSALGIQSARSGAAQIGMADLVELPPEARELLGV